MRPATKLIAVILAGAASVALAGTDPGAQQQARPAAAAPVPDAVRRLGASIDNALAGPEYADLDPLQRRTVGLLAVNAALIIETGQCADPSAAGSAVESFLVLFVGIARKPLQPIFALPASAKADLVDRALALEQQRAPDPQLAQHLCDGRLLADSAIKPIAERRAAARLVLLTGLSPAAPQPPTGGAGAGSPAADADSAHP